VLEQNVTIWVTSKEYGAFQPSNPTARGGTN